MHFCTWTHGFQIFRTHSAVQYTEPSKKSDKDYLQRSRINTGVDDDDDDDDDGGGGDDDDDGGGDDRSSNGLKLVFP